MCFVFVPRFFFCICQRGELWLDMLGNLGNGYTMI